MTAQTRQMVNPVFTWANQSVKDRKLRLMVELTPQDTYRLEHRTQVIKVVQGMAWIVLDGQDYIVNAGQGITVPARKEPIIVTSLKRKPVIFEVW